MARATPHPALAFLRLLVPESSLISPPVQPVSWPLLDQRGPCPGAVETPGSGGVAFQRSLVLRGDRREEGSHRPCLRSSGSDRGAGGNQPCPQGHPPPPGGIHSSNQRVQSLTPGAWCSPHGVPSPSSVAALRMPLRRILTDLHTQFTFALASPPLPRFGLKLTSPRKPFWVSPATDRDGIRPRAPAVHPMTPWCFSLRRQERSAVHPGRGSHDVLHGAEPQAVCLRRP